MIAYVDCLSTEPAGKCWNKTYYEDEDELLPLHTRKLNLQPKTEGSLRRRVLTSKIHQQQDALWAPKPWAGPPARKGVPLQGQPNYTFSPSCHDWKGSASNLVCSCMQLKYKSWCSKINYLITKNYVGITKNGQ